MATFEIEQYEVHVMNYRVEADNHAEAIVKLLRGGGEPLDYMLEFVEVCRDKGLTADSVPDIATHLRQAGIELGGLAVPVIPSIRECYQVD
jgi:hypothetical protein